MHALVLLFCPIDLDEYLHSWTVGAIWTFQVLPSTLPVYSMRAKEIGEYRYFAIVTASWAMVTSSFSMPEDEDNQTTRCQRHPDIPVWEEQVDTCKPKNHQIYCNVNKCFQPVFFPRFTVTGQLVPACNQIWSNIRNLSLTSLSCARAKSYGILPLAPSDLL